MQKHSCVCGMGDVGYAVMCRRLWVERRQWISILLGAPGQFEWSVLGAVLESLCASLTCCCCCLFAQVTTETGIRRLVPAADIDDYVFEPCGYSMNGILGGGFITIHITPEQVRTAALFFFGGGAAAVGRGCQKGMA